MFHILGFLFIIIVVILVIGLSIIGTVLRSIFGLGKRRTSSGSYQNGGGSYQSGGGSYQSGGGYSFSGDQQQTASSQANEGTTSSEDVVHRKHKKLFTKDEGEYVDFEEIKE